MFSHFHKKVYSRKFVSKSCLFLCVMSMCLGEFMSIGDIVRECVCIRIVCVNDSVTYGVSVCVFM